MRIQYSIGWITALRSAAIRALVEQGHLQLDLFDETNFLEITSPDFPGERLVACRNPQLAKSRAHKREDLLAAIEVNLAKIRARVATGKLAEADAIGLAVGKIINQYKVAKHFDPVAPAKRSKAALLKVARRTLDDGSAVNSFSTLMNCLATIVRNTCRTVGTGSTLPTFEITTTPNAVELRAMTLIEAIRL